MLGLVRKMRRSSSTSSTSSSGSETAAAAGGGSGVATLLLKDGTVRDYTRRKRCEEVLAENPGSRGVCPARGVLLKEAGCKVLPKDAYLELGTIYFLLAPDNGSTGSSTSGASGVKFVITKEYVARIMEDAGAGAGAGARAPARERQQHCSLPSAKRARSRQLNWVASLSTIPEVASV